MIGCIGRWWLGDGCVGRWLVFGWMYGCVGRWVMVG